MPSVEMAEYAYMPPPLSAEQSTNVVSFTEPVSTRIQRPPPVFAFRTSAPKVSWPSKEQPFISTLS